MKPFPPLRNIEAIPIEHEGQTVIYLHDTAGYIEDQVALSLPAFFIAASLDGAHDTRAIQRDFAHQFEGAKIPEDQIRQVVAFLDEHGFLFSERFQAIRDEIETVFRRQERRSAHLAGKGYPDNPEELRLFIDKFFSRPGGPGDKPNTTHNASPLRGLIVPHIDFERGGHCYAHGYAQLRDMDPPDSVIIFGVAHGGAETPFALTQKHFDTPFGVIENDRETVARIERACTWDPYLAEPAHRTEHSIEFQAVMLGYLFGNKTKIVPILCAALSNDPHNDSPSEIGEIGRFLDVCREIADAPGKRVIVVASADLAHVGNRFGDTFEIDNAIIEGVTRRDHEDLNHVLACAPDAFYRAVMRDRNQRKVCGLACIYAALKTIAAPGRTGELLHYHFAHDPAGGIVSFASIALR